MIDYKTDIIRIGAGLGFKSDTISFFKSFPSIETHSGCHHESGHHYGEGGLLRHKWEVINLCMRNAIFFCYNDIYINETVLFMAALFHDVGKLWDYEKEGSKENVFEVKEHRRLIHHVSRSAIEWNKWASQQNFDESFTDKVTHCILSHHGQRQWGSPVGPANREAWILHLCDSMSARVDDCERIDLFTHKK